ncbi:MAG: hypothetical protein SFU56_14255 [Capsulimonadales bacterium]|nr:hypothetical protein [Capsulimonadales bacterium]
MHRYMVYYWMQQGDKGASLCEYLNAESLDEATSQIQRRLDLPTFAFDSEGRGRVIVRTAHIQYVEIEVGEEYDSDMPEQNTFSIN